MVRLRKAANGNINTRHGEDAGRSFPHVGIDIGWGGGTELYAPAAGWITWAWVGTYGNRCIITHADGTWSLIAHAAEFFGTNGRNVERGEHIGTMGRTGGPWGSAGWYVHCHQEYHLADGRAVNPENYFGADTAGLDETPVKKDLGDIEMRYVWADKRGGMLLTEKQGPKIPVTLETAQVQSKLYNGVDISTREWDVARQDAIDRAVEAGRLDPITKAVNDAFNAALAKLVANPSLPNDPADIELLAYKVARATRAEFAANPLK